MIECCISTNVKVGVNVHISQKFCNFSLQENLVQPQMMVLADVNDVFVPMVDGFLVDVADSRNVIEKWGNGNVWGCIAYLGLAFLFVYFFYDIYSQSNGYATRYVYLKSYSWGCSGTCCQSWYGGNQGTPFPCAYSIFLLFLLFYNC